MIMYICYLNTKVNALTKHKYESTLTPVRVPQASVDNHTYTYNKIGKLATINQDILDYELTYGVNEQRIEAIKKEYGQVVYTKQYINTASMEVKNGEELTYLYAEGQPFAIHKKTIEDVEEMYYLHLDHLGSIMSITDQSGSIVETRRYDAWGRPQDPNTWSYQLTPFGALNITDRGYTFHEHLIEFSLINMNGRMYDPVLGRVISPDNYIQAPDNTQSFNRYSYCFNNPLKYTDPNGNIIFTAMIVGAIVFGTANLAVQASNGEINSFGDGLKAFGAGAVAGAAIGTGVGFGLGVPILGAAIQGAGWIYAGTTVVSGISGLGHGIATGDWSRLQNTGKIFAGNFYLDSKRGGDWNFFAQAWQGISRFSWELPQSTVGHGYSQVRNAFGGVDRVDYFGGATFSTNENAGYRDGVSIGNHININIADKIQGRFADRVTSDPLFMHEYGHTFDSQIFGLSYLFAVGIPSILSAKKSTYDPITGGSTHDLFWTERRANRHAAKYFKKLNIDWSKYEMHQNPFGYYPQ